MKGEVKTIRVYTGDDGPKVYNTNKFNWGWDGDVFEVWSHDGTWQTIYPMSSIVSMVEDIEKDQNVPDHLIPMNQKLSCSRPREIFASG